MPASAPRTLADQLRGWSDGDLAALLDARPDLAVPAPTDSAQLAARAATRTSVLRALDDLTQLELTVLEAVVNAGPVAFADLGRIVYADNVAPALATLTARLLVWDDGRGLRALTVLGEILGLPAGPDPDDLRRLLGEVGERARAILDHFNATDAVATDDAPRTRLTVENARTPTEQLLSRRLLAPRDARHVVVPWSVRLALRDGRSTREPVDVVPTVAVSTLEPAAVDRSAAGAAFEVVRRTEVLLDHWGTRPPGALRGGGLGVRELRAVATLLHVETGEAALLVEIAAAAGLLATGMTPDADAAWLPTDRFDTWQAQPTAARWARLATAWLESPRLVSLVGGRDHDKPVNALSEGLERSWLVPTRREALGELAALAPGEVLAPGTGLPSLLDRLHWLRPRRPATRDAAVEHVLAEATQLGLVGRGGMSAHGRRLLAGEDAEAALAQRLPEPVDHVLLQADLTAVAPGPLDSDLARQLALVADVESRGGATVYRFAASSVRRAFDAGWSAAEVRDFVSSVSRTPVPQALEYLIDDVSRRFGVLRAGQAESFLRSDDETALTELMHNGAAASLRLRRIAPTVVVSDVPVSTLLPRLRDLGLAPVLEAPDGTVHVARPDVLRAREPRRRAPAVSATRARARTSAVVAAVRSGDRAAASRPRRTLVASPADLVTMLRNAADAGDQVVIGYVGNDGTVAERVVEPRRVEGGRLTAYDERADDDRTFAIHRITAARVSE